MEGSDTTRSRLSPPAVVLVLLASLLLALAVEGGASFVAAYRAAQLDAARVAASGGILEQRHCEYDELLGWMNRPNVTLEDLYEPGTRFTTNSQRLRAPRDYTRAVPPGRFRVVCLGDSFTMGYGVDDEATIPALLEASSDRLEVINMGLGAFGLDQDYLWYLRDGVQFETDLLLFLVVLDDFERITTDKFSGLFPKPVLEVVDDELVTRNVPVPRSFSAEERARSEGPHLAARIARQLAFWKLVAPHTPIVQHGRKRNLAGRILTELRDLSRRRGQGFAVVYLPMNRKLVHTPERMRIIRWLEEFTRAEGIPYYDLVASFSDVEPRALRGYFAHDHYSEQGTRLVAEALGEIVARDFVGAVGAEGVGVSGSGRLDEGVGGE